MDTKDCAECKKPFKPSKGRWGDKACGVCRGRTARRKDSESIEAKARGMALRARARAASRGLPCDIDALWIVTRWYAQHGRCHFSGRPMTLKVGPMNVSLDRINSAKGYTRKNTVLAALQANLMKSDMSVTDFIGWCESISEYSKPRDEQVGVNPETLKP